LQTGGGGLFVETALPDNDPHLVALTARLVQSAQEELTEGAEIDRAVQTRALVCQICGLARMNGMQPERILLHIKEAWGAGGMKRVHSKSDRWYQELIRLCLEEYYKPIPE
jgi:hypothetical protein